MLFGSFGGFHDSCWPASRNLVAAPQWRCALREQRRQSLSSGPVNFDVGDIRRALDSKWSLHVSLGSTGSKSCLDNQNGQNNGPYTAYSLYFKLLGHYFELFWRSRCSCGHDRPALLWAPCNPGPIPPLQSRP